MTSADYKKKIEQYRIKCKKEHEQKCKECEASLPERRELLIENKRLKDENEKLEREVRELRDWNLRLLEYTELSEDDLRNLKKVAEGEGVMGQFVGILERYMGNFR